MHLSWFPVMCLMGYVGCVWRHYRTRHTPPGGSRVKDAPRTPPGSWSAAPGLWSPQTMTSDNCVWFLKADTASVKEIFKSAHVIACSRTHSWKPRRSGTLWAGCNWPAWTFLQWQRLQILLYPERTQTHLHFRKVKLIFWQSVGNIYVFVRVSSPVFYYIGGKVYLELTQES